MAIDPTSLTDILDADAPEDQAVRTITGEPPAPAEVADEHDKSVRDPGLEIPDVNQPDLAPVPEPADGPVQVAGPLGKLLKPILRGGEEAERAFKRAPKREFTTVDRLTTS